MDENLEELAKELSVNIDDLQLKLHFAITDNVMPSFTFAELRILKDCLEVAGGL